MDQITSFDEAIEYVGQFVSFDDFFYHVGNDYLEDAGFVQMGDIFVLGDAEPNTTWDSTLVGGVVLFNPSMSTYKYLIRGSVAFTLVRKWKAEDGGIYSGRKTYYETEVDFCGLTINVRYSADNESIPKYKSVRAILYNELRVSSDEHMTCTMDKVVDIDDKVLSRHLSYEPSGEIEEEYFNDLRMPHCRFGPAYRITDGESHYYLDGMWMRKRAWEREKLNF